MLKNLLIICLIIIILYLYLSKPKYQSKSTQTFVDEEKKQDNFKEGRNQQSLNLDKIQEAVNFFSDLGEENKKPPELRSYKRLLDVESKENKPKK